MLSIFLTTIPLLALSVSALPQATTAPSAAATTTPPPSSITSAPTLTCSAGSTITTTTDCTYGNTYSFCYSAPPPLQCSSGYYPGIVNYGHCESASTCYPVDAPWITTTCPDNGETAWSTSTLYSGTLAGGQSTVITQVECECATNLWYSWYYSATLDQVYCMPHTDCPAGMTTSTSTNSYCLTASSTDTNCATELQTQPFCECTAGTPVYGGAATPTACA